jgi:methylated-DNA-[protein]-cysteine S-methyltransferase
MNAIVTRVESAAGPLDVYVLDGKVVALGFDTQAGALRARLRTRFGAIAWQASENNAGVRRASSRRRRASVAGSDQIAALKAYLDGELDALDTLEIDPGGTPFQREVWRALRRVRPGRTISYGELAARIGRPTAVRAVARANALNPISLVIPCHRVIGKDGELCGYAGGLARKAWLLAHERG